MNWTAQSLTSLGFNPHITLDVEDIPSCKQLANKLPVHQFVIEGKRRGIFRSSVEIDKYHDRINQFPNAKKLKNCYVRIEVSAINPYYAEKLAQKILDPKFKSSKTYYNHTLISDTFRWKNSSIEVFDWNTETNCSYKRIPKIFTKNQLDKPLPIADSK